jgi:hypothetical protein
MRYSFIIFLLSTFLVSISAHAEGYLKALGKKVVDANGNEVLLRGMGLGGWMLQEGYMLETSDFAGPQHAIKATIEKLVGEEATQEFYNAWLANYCTKADVDSMAAWGFNSIRLPMHYNLFTLPIEEEPALGKDTWLEKGFQMTDSLLKWCAANKMYLILDLHAAPGGQGKDANISDYDSSKKSLWESAENRRKTVALWKKLAERYANEPWIGAYDLINEPNWDIDNAGNQNGCSCNQNTALWNLYKEIIKAIRTVDNNHIVILEGNCWGNNYNGLTNIKSFDSNLVLSFHKYWSYNDVASIQGIMNLRNTHNVPIWLGESGENSNPWFTSAIRLVESNGIGWAWWPYKKIGSVTGTVTIPKTEGWEKLLSYWKGSGTKPTEDQAKQWLMEQAEAMKLKNSIIHYDVVDAMFRQVTDRTAKPFKKHKTPCTIFAADYDLGGNGNAYFDVDSADYHVSTNKYVAWNTGYAYRNDAVDIESCTDVETIGYSVGWIENGEWMVYTIDVEETAAYNLDIRYAAQGSSGKLHLELDGFSVTPQISLASTGAWNKWATKTLENVILKKGRHQLKLYVDNSGFNLNFLRIYSPKELGVVTPEILDIKTDANGSEILLTSNLDFDTSSLISTSDFQLKVNGENRSLTFVAFDDVRPELLVLYFEGSLIANDKVTLSFSGKNLISKYQTSFGAFENRPVVNNSPKYLLLPSRFQAEDFSLNNGFNLETCTDTGGGQNLSYANPGDYVDYPVYVKNAGVYKFDYRVASQNSGRFKMQLIANETTTDLHTITASTGGWQTWKTQSAAGTLPKGKCTLRVNALSGEFNLNWLNVTLSALTDVKQHELDDVIIGCSGVNQPIYLYFNSTESSTANVTCYSSNGQKVFSERLNMQDNQHKRLSNKLSKQGIYLLHIETKNQSVSSKMIVH